MSETPWTGGRVRRVARLAARVLLATPFVAAAVLFARHGLDPFAIGAVVVIVVACAAAAGLLLFTLRAHERIPLDVADVMAAWRARDTSFHLVPPSRILTWLVASILTLALRQGFAGGSRPELPEIPPPRSLR